MRVRNSCLIDMKQFIAMFLIAGIYIAIPIALMKLLPHSFYLMIVIVALFVIWWLGMTIYLTSCFIYPLGYNVIDGRGITRHFLFFKKHYNWNDLQFISKTRTHARIGRGGFGAYNAFSDHDGVGCVVEKIIVSVKIPKEAFKRSHTYRLYSKKCFYMPYSKELESYIIAKAPIGCYTYSYFIDDTIDKKYSNYNTQ